jgi:hypothetical protein
MAPLQLWKARLLPPRWLCSAVCVLCICLSACLCAVSRRLVHGQLSSLQACQRSCVDVFSMRRRQSRSIRYLPHAHSACARSRDARGAGVSRKELERLSARREAACLRAVKYIRTAFRNGEVATDHLLLYPSSFAHTSP